MRRHAMADDAGSLRVHDHVAWCGDGQAELDLLAVEVFTAGAQTGERMMFIAEDPEPDRLAGISDLDRKLADGVLELASLDEVYAPTREHGPAAQLAGFTDALETALADGFSGLRVVADNTPLVRGDDDDLAGWLAWEQLTDQFQADRPVLGVCFFDRRQISLERLHDLAAVHPMTSGPIGMPDFRMFRDGDALWISGTLDTFSAERLRRVLPTIPPEPELVIDVSDCELINHHALLAFNEYAHNGTRIHLRNASSTVRRVWDFLGVSTDNVRFD